MCACRVMNCQRGSERLMDAEGFWQRVAAQTNSEVVCFRRPAQIHTCRFLCYFQSDRLESVYPQGFAATRLNPPWEFVTGAWLGLRSLCQAATVRFISLGLCECVPIKVYLQHGEDGFWNVTKWGCFCSYVTLLSGTSTCSIDSIFELNWKPRGQRRVIGFKTTHW